MRTSALLAAVCRPSLPGRRRALWLLLACVAASAVLFRAFVHDSFYNFTWRDLYRRTLSYWGVGWCEPYTPPRTEHRFAPHEGAGLSWAGDENFWRLFPCARDNYRVVLPDGAAASGEVGGLAAGAAAAAAAGAAAAPPPAASPSPSSPSSSSSSSSSSASPPPADSCRSTLVTGMFDIGREHWASYPRSHAAYLRNAELVLGLPNRMVLFTQPDLVDHFVAERRRRGLMDRTMVVGMSVYCVPYAWLLEPVTRLMCSDGFSRGAAFLEIPERQQPFYNLLMYAKTLFLQAAAALPLAGVNSSYYTWLDLGCHDPMCEPWMAGRCLDPSPWTREDRIRIALTTPMSPAVWAEDDATWAKNHHVHMAGTVFGTSKRAAAQLADTFSDALHVLIAQGMLCYDQTIFALAFRRWPERFDVVHVLFDNWNKIVSYYSRQTVPQGELPAEWRTRQGQPPDLK